MEKGLLSLNEWVKRKREGGCTIYLNDMNKQFSTLKMDNPKIIKLKCLLQNDFGKGKGEEETTRFPFPDFMKSWERKIMLIFQKVHCCNIEFPFFTL